MPFDLLPLPYSEDALGDIMSAETLACHHGKHHQGYVDRVNGLLINQSPSGISLREVITTARRQGDVALFNSAAQVWNHNFFWKCLSPEPQKPEGRLAKLIGDSFGTLDGLILSMTAEAIDHFSNGWVWLVLEGNSLKVTSLHDGDTPLVHREMRPVLALDVWEHAYYVDYRNARLTYVEKVLGNIVNWKFAEQNLDGQGALRADQRFQAYRFIKDPSRRRPKLPQSRTSYARELPEPGEQVVS